MENTITALQNFYTALGGTASDVENITIIPDMLNAIAEQITANTTAAANNTEEVNSND